MTVTLTEPSAARVRALPARVPVAVVGGGQAGLSLSWHLVHRGIEHVVLERETIAHEWADARWDSFCLVTPNPHDGKHKEEQGDDEAQHIFFK